MCAPSELIVITLFAVAAPVIIWAAVLQHQFYRLLRERHPLVWSSFGQHGFFKYDESPQESAAGWYLFTGGYVYLRDDLITRKGRAARVVFIAAAGLLFSWFLAMQLPTYGSAVACLSERVTGAFHAK